MKNIIKLLLISAVILLNVSCGGKEVKTDDQGVIITASAIKTIDEVKEAYIKRDLEKIHSLTTDEEFRLFKSQFKDFDVASITFTPIWVEIHNETIKLTFAWEGTWKQGVSDPLGRVGDQPKDKKQAESVLNTTEKGVVIFVLLPKTYKISQILRANPFTFPQ